MKKMVAALAAGFIITGTAATTVSAEEHEVQKGESLWELADKYNTTVDELVDINDLKSTVIHPKEVLVINNTYSVKVGDTLNSISKEYDITVDELKEWNNLKSDLIVIGQELNIQGVHVAQADSEPTATTTEAENNEKPAEESDNVEPVAAEPAEDVAEEPAENESDQSPEGETVSVKATAYTADCDGCSGTTYTGVNLKENPNAKVIAVDPNVIPLGSEVYVEGYGYATAADIGGAIKGNKIDIHVPTKDDAVAWGVKTVDVTIVE